MPSTMSTDDIKIIVEQYEKEIKYSYQLIEGVHGTILIVKQLMKVLSRLGMSATGVEKVLSGEFRAELGGANPFPFLPETVQKEGLYDYALDLFQDYAMSIDNWKDNVKGLFDPETNIIKNEFDTMLALVEDILSDFWAAKSEREQKKEIWLMHVNTGFNMRDYRNTIDPDKGGSCDGCGCLCVVKSEKELWETLVPLALHAKFLIRSTSD